MWQGLVGPCHFCLWDFLMWGLGGAVPEKGVFVGVLEIWV